MEDKRKALYDALSGEYNLGTYEDFTNKLNDESKRKALYEAAGQEYNLGTYEEYSSKLGFDSGSDESSMVNTEIPMFNDEPNAIEGERGIKAGAREGWKAMKAGFQNLWGETANIFTGTSRDSYNALYELDNMLRSGKDVESEVEGAWTDFGRELRTGAAEFFLPIYSGGLKKRIQDKADEQKVLNDIREALQEAGGDVDKARKILLAKTKDLSYGDKQIQEASEKFADIKPTEGFGAWVGSNLVQMIPSASALIVGALTKSPGAAKAIGTIGMAGMTASTMGSSMHEAREAGANDYKTWKVGVTDGMIEYLTEKLPFDRYTSRIVGKLKGNVADDLFKAINAPDGNARKELEALLINANNRLGGKLFSKKNLSEYMVDMIAEGASEFSAEALQTMTAMMYEDPENYPTINEILLNGWEGAKAGVFMGAILGGASKTMEHNQHRQRRMDKGSVDIAQITLEDGNTDVVEVVDYDAQNNKATIFRDGNFEVIDGSAISDGYRFSYEEFEKARLRQMEDEAIVEGKVSDGQITGLEETVTAELQTLRDMGMTEEQIAQITSGDPMFSYDPESEIGMAINQYREDSARLAEMKSVKEQAMQERRKATKEAIEASVGQPFWTTLENNKNADGVITYSEYVEEVLYADGRVGYVVGSDDSGNLTMVFNDGTKGFSSREEITDKLNSGEIISDTPTGLDEYIDSKINAEIKADEDVRMAEDYSLSVEEMIATHPMGTIINVGTTEARVEVPIVAPPTKDGVIVQMPDGTTPLMRWEDVAHAERKEITPKTNAQIDRSIADQYKVAYTPVAKAGETAPIEVREEEVKADSPATPLPLKADGSVDQTALWNESPARWAKWNEEQRQDGGAHSVSFLTKNAIKLRSDIMQLQAEQDANLDPDMESQYEQQLASYRERLSSIMDALGQYVTADTAEQIAKGEILPGAIPVSPITEMTSETPMTDEEAEQIEDRRREPLRQRAKELSQKLGVKINIAESLADVKESSAREEILSADVSGGKTKVPGWFNPDNGEVTIYLPHAQDTTDLERTIIHEVVAHKGLRGLLGEEGYNVLCDSVWEMMTEKERQDFLNYPGVNGNKRAAADEYIAHFAEKMNLDESKPVWDRIMDVIMKILNSMGVQLEMSKDQLSDVIIASYHKLLQDARAGAIAEESEAVAEDTEEQTPVVEEGMSPEEQIEEAGMEVDEENEDVRFSVRYLPTPEQRELLLDGIVELTGRTRVDAERWLQSELSLASVVLSDREYLDYAPDQKYKAIKDNSDYPQGTVGFNNICRKRKDFTQMYTRLQRAYPNRIFTAEDLADIRTIMSEDGLVVACGLCYVEDRRQKLGEVADEFIKDLQDGFKAYGKKNATKRANAQKFAALVGEDTYVPSIYDLITLEGSDRLHDEHRGIWEAFGAYNRARGQQTQNTFQGYAEYKREILSWSDAKVKKVNSLGGLRIFSYSDFEAHHLLDIIQIIIDCAARGVMIQGYTKVPAFARVVAKTGIKLNRSLIPLGDTGIVDGKLAYDPVEGIDINDPDFLESNDNVGNILIGINDEQIRMAMLDPFIHFIIPYHARQAGNIRAKLNVGAWTNYIDTQNERKASDGKRVEKNINIYTEVLGENITNDKEFVEKYLEVCKEKGYIPKFDQFLERDAEGNYIYTPGYYKFLVDFKLFDEDGNILPQNAVVAEFDDEFNAQILRDYAAEERDTTGTQMNSTYDKIVETLNLGEPSEGTDVRFREKSDGPIDLVEEAKKAQARHDAEEDKKSDVTFRITPEMKEIKEKAEKDGTFMKAPNGQPTNLTEEQWAMVRTKAFKAWFGDWEKAARIQKLRNSEDASIAGDEIAPAESIDKKAALEYGKKLQGFYTNKDTGASIQLQRGRKNGGVNEVLQHNYKDVEHLQSIAAIPQIIEKSIFIESVPNADIEKNPDVVEYQHFVCGLKIGGEDYTVHSLVAVDKKGDRYYDHNLTSIEKKKLLDLIESQAVEGEDFGTTPGTQPTILSTYKGKQLVSLLQVDASKVVDANGEPKVVYHGTNRVFYKFRTRVYDWSDLPLGVHFGTKEQAEEVLKRHRIGKDVMMPVFLNIRNPYRVKDQINRRGWDEMVIKAKYGRLDGQNGQPADGIVYTNEYEARQQRADSYVVWESNQIKSATDNNGDFNPKNEDIRFRFAPRTDEQREQLFDKAKAHYGLTNNFNASGYMLPDGSLLDFSEANDGGDPNRRSLDHRDIEGLIMDEGKEYDSRYHYVVDFVDEGAIRMLPEAAGFQLSVPPTAEQRSRLMDYIYKHNGEVIMEITDENGGPRVYMEYNKRTSPSRIFRDMDGFFNEGVVPGIPPLRFRIANDNQAIFVSNAARAVEGIKQEKATPEQWLKMIEKNGGLKAGEDKWMGLSDFLKASDKKTLTKQEVLDFINENMIQIEEVHYDTNAEERASDAHSEIVEVLQNKYNDYVAEYHEEHGYDDEYDDPASKYAIEKLREEMEDSFPYTIELVFGNEVYVTFDYEEEDDMVKWAEKTGVEYTPGANPINKTRLGYTTSGLQNKQEIALVVPTIESWNDTDEVHFGDAGDGRAVAWIRFGETRINDESAVESARRAVDEASERERAILDKRAKAESEEEYRSLYPALEEAIKAREEAVRAWNKAKDDAVRKKVLVIDEIQSKRHQEGREKGYIVRDENYEQRRVEWRKAKREHDDFLREMDEKYGEWLEYASEEEIRKTVSEEEFNRAVLLINTEDEARRAYQRLSGRIPDAPFDKNWHELAMKRMLRYAAENGYDVIAWTKGDQQADRYSIGGIVDAIDVADVAKGRFVYLSMEGGNIIKFIVNSEGEVIDGNSDYKGRQLSDIVGKDLSLKILNAENGATLSGNELRIGGEGMKGFYDKMLPAFMNKYGKKWGVKVEDIELPNLEEAGRVMHSVPVTEEMKTSVMEGQVMFRMRNEGETAEEFAQWSIDEYRKKYTEVAPISIVDISSRQSIADVYGLPVDEIPEEIYEGFKREYEKGDLGFYMPGDYKYIAIFARDGITDSSHYEDTLIHENMHALLDIKGREPVQLGAWLYNNVKAPWGKRIKDFVDANYSEDRRYEEMLTNWLTPHMVLGKSENALAKVPAEYKQNVEYIYNELGYDRRAEESRRGNREELSDSRNASDSRLSKRQGLQAGENSSEESRGRGVQSSGNGVSGLEPAKSSEVASGKRRDAEDPRSSLSAEERRRVNEIFPGTFKMTDSKGKELTPAQEKFFANSKAVDKEGNLLVLYHGTPRAGFTEFKSGWFTTSKEDADSYSGDRKGRLFDPNEQYEPETLTAGDFPLGYMTFDSEEDRNAFLAEYPDAESAMSESEFDSMTLQADEEYDDLIARKPQLQKIWNAYREYERERFVDTTIGDLIANPDAYTEDDFRRAMLAYDSNASFDNLDDMDAAERKDALVSALQNANEETEGGILDMVVPTRVPRNGEGQKHNDLGNRTYEVYANVENPYEIDANGRGSEFESGDIYKSVEEALADEHYDGVIIRNWRVGRTQQLGDVVVPKNGNQIKLTSNENPTESSDIRFRTSLQLDDEFGDAWRDQQNEDGRHSTQVSNTKSTYEKIGRYLEGAGMKGASILDASSGLGLGTQALREMGFEVDDVEPFPSESREAPTFASYADIDKKYDVVISNAVLNVIPDDWRSDVLHQMADAVKEGGKIIINTRPASNISQQGIEGKTRITLDSPSEILVKRGDRIAAYQKGFTSEELAEWIQSELGEGWRVEKATKKNSGISGEGTAVVIKEGEPRLRVGTPTDEVVKNGLNLTPVQTAELAGNIFAALPEDSRKKITEGLSGNILGLQDAILQIPTSLASKEEWNEEDRAMADIVAEEMTKMAGEMTRPFSASEGLWLLYTNLNKSTDLVSEASRALVKRNLGFDAETLAKQEQAKEGVRFRTVGNATINATASMYNRGAVNVWTRLKESYVDMHASVEKLVKSIEKRSGKVAQGFEDILMALNQQSSKGLAAMESYEQKFLKPMFDAIRKIMDKTDFKYEDIVRHVILKHGLERNIKMAQRDAKAHYQEIYDEIISLIKSLDDAQKRTYLTNAHLKRQDALAKLATLQHKDTSAMTEEEVADHKRELAKAHKAVEEAEKHFFGAEKVAHLSEAEAQKELEDIFKSIESGKNSVYKELRKNDYSGISSMFYDTLGVDRKNYPTEEQYQAALMQAKNDKYDSLADIEAAAEREVSEFEKLVSTDQLWKSINRATKETLRQQYEANMISKEQYENLRDMFEYYVPLRGFKDNTAEDMYTYYRKPNSTGYTKPILGAEGRKTEAESPFGWIASMAGSAIASNVKNEAKLALYYFVANRPENGVATLSKTWFVHTPGDVDANGKKIFHPAYPPFSEDLSTDVAKQAYEDWQEQMRDLQKQGLAYEAGQRVNLGNAVVNIDQKNIPEHIVAVKVGGKDYTIVINGNPRAAQAINGDLNIESTQSDYSALFGPMLRWMSSVNTSYNPEFWITNMMRDMAFTMMAVNIKEDPAYRRKFKKNYAKAFKVISMVAKNEKGTLGDSYIEDMYKDFVKYGGVTGYTQIKDSETWEKEIENYLSSNDPESIKSGKAMRWVKSAFHVAHRFGESLEQVSRFAAFMTARETGKSINEAINDAKEITVNFNRKGSGKMISLEEAKYLTDKNGQPLNKFQQWMAVGASSIAPLGRRFIMFFNAAIQGLNATYKLYKKNKTRAIGWALGYVAIGVMNAVLHAMFDDDDDYLDIPQYERRNSLMLGGNGVYFKWALPQEARAFYALGDLAVESFMGRNPHQNVLGESLKIATEVLPVNPTEGWKAFLPSVAIPFVELGINKDYKGAPIYNDQKWLTEAEKELSAKWSKAYKGTGKIYINFAKAMNAITGGDEYDAGLINLQPEKIEHLVQSAFGGTIRTADKFITTIMNAIDPEEDVTVRQLPFLNRILTINDERYKNVHVNDVYDYYKAEAEHAMTLQKQYAKNKDKEAFDKLKMSEEYKWAMIYNKYKKPIKNIQEKIKVADTTAERMDLMRQQDELKKQMIKEISEL